MSRPSQVESPPQHSQKGHPALLAIGLFRLFKGLSLVAIGIGAHKLRNADLGETVARWINTLGLDPENRVVHEIARRLSSVTPTELKIASVGTFFYAALLLTEGVGLLMKKTWAEYLTIVATTGLIPIEIYEIAKHVTPFKIGLLLVNIVIVAYLVLLVRRHR